MSEPYKTKDLGEAAALVTKGLSFLAEFNGHVCWFVFADTDKAKDLSEEYYFNGLLVDARQFKETTQRLIQIIKTHRE